MTHRVLNRVCQASVNKPNASAAYDFTGAATFPPFFTFNSRTIATGDTLGYEAMDESGDYERGLGTWNNTTKTLTRTTIRESTNAGAAVDWSGSASAVTVISDGRQEEDLLAIGTTATTACAGNDARLSDDRTPTSHTLDSHSGTLAKTKGGWGEDTTSIWDGTTKTLRVNTITTSEDTIYMLGREGDAEIITGSFLMLGGNSLYGDGGNFAIYGGTGASDVGTSSAGGNVDIYGGYARYGGNVTIGPGYGEDIHGYFRIVDSSGSAIVVIPSPGVLALFSATGIDGTATFTTATDLTTAITAIGELQTLLRNMGAAI